MKYLKIVALLVFSSVIFFYACNDKTNAPAQETTTQDTSNPVDVSNSTAVPNATTPTATTPTAATPTPAPTEAAQNASGVWHYTCNTGCAGGAGSAVNCNTCGKLLAHNTAYHAKTNTATTSAPFANPTTTATAAKPAAEPSQNAAGVWHYTCSKGCAGGSGGTGNCGTCGGPLGHNTAYHQ